MFPAPWEVLRSRFVCRNRRSWLIGFAEANRVGAGRTNQETSRDFLRGVHPAAENFIDERQSQTLSEAIDIWRKQFIQQKGVDQDE